MRPEVVSHYRIRRRLGAGGMGEVYLADDLTLKRPVAIKLLTSEDLTDDQVRRNLLREAQAAASLDHPNICPVYEVGTDGDLSFIVMQFVEGETLAARLKQGRLSPDEALDVVSQVADALAAAHRQGVVHRDIKPQNIMLTSRGGLKVLDFGLAKRAPSGPASEEMTLSTVGQSGRVVGTAPYMSPEQVKQESVDGRSDLFALGATYYECLTGRRAFSGKSPLEICGQVLHVEPPPPSSINDQLGPAHDELCRQLLAKRPDDRVQTGEEALRLLELARQIGTVTVRHTTPQPAPARGWTVGRFLVTRRRLSVVASVGAFSTLVLVGFWWQPWSSTAPTDTEQAALRQAVSGSDTVQKYVVVMPLAAVALEDQALTDGLTDALASKLSQLSRSHGLQVASASMVRELDQATVNEVGTELGVTLAVLCGVQRDGQQLRVTLTLVEAPGGREVESDTVTAARGDPFLLQDRVLAAVTGLLDIELEPHELDALRAYGTQVPEAYYLYLEGRGHLERLDRNNDVDRRQALDLDSDYALARAGLGSAYWQKYNRTNQPDAALQAAAECQQAVELDEQQAASHVCLGTVYGSLGRHDEAIVEFTRAISIEPTSPDALHALALAYEQMGSVADAEQAHKEAIQMLPHHWAGYRWLGAFYLSESRYAEASDMFERVLGVTPDSYTGYSNLGVAYANQERWPEAFDALERSVEIKPSVQGYSNLATLYFFQGRYFRAARLYEDAVSLDERNYLIWGNLGDARYWSPGDEREAEDAYEEALSLAEELRSVTPQEALLLGDMALYNAMLGRSAPALELVLEALELAPDDRELQLQAAQTYQQLGRTNEALQLLEAALDGDLAPTLVSQNPWFESIQDTAEFRALMTTP